VAEIVAKARTEPPVPAYSWYALGVLTLVYMVNFVDRQILSILANDIKRDLGLTDADLGFLYGTAFAIFYALFGIPLGRLADSWSRTRLLAIGLALWSSMTALSGLARSGAALSLARIGVGVGEATASPCAYSLLSDWFPARLRATALAIYSSGLFIGSGISLLLGATIVEQWNLAYPDGGPLGLAGWQAAFIIVGLPGLGLALWVLSLREPARGSDATDSAPLVASPGWEFLQQLTLILPPLTLWSAARAGRSALAVNLGAAAGLAAAAFGLARVTGDAGQFWLLAIGFYAVFSWASALRRSDPATYRLTFGTPAFVQIVLTYAAISVVGYTVIYWAAPYGERTFGLTKTEIGWLIGAPAAIGGFAGVILGGWLADTLQKRSPVGRLKVLLIGVLAPVAIVLVGYSTSDPRVFLLCAFLVQMATSSALGVAGAASQSLVLPHMRGTATAIFFLGATLIGLGLGPYVAGLVSELAGSLAWGVRATLLAAPCGLLVLMLAMRTYAASEASAAARAAQASAGMPALK
jgi:MFS family permease